MPKYRYITYKAVRPDDRLSRFPIWGSTNLGARDGYYLRVTVPNNVHLIKERDSMFSKTDSDIRIKNLDPIAIVRINWRARPMKGLWPHPMHEWPDLMRKKGYETDIHCGFRRIKPAKIETTVHETETDDSLNLKASVIDASCGSKISICRIIINKRLDEWTISAWYTYSEEQKRSGYGKLAMKKALSACMSHHKLPKTVKYIWNGVNEYVLDWMTKHFDATCTCPLAIQKKAPDDDWESHIYELDTKKMIAYFGLDAPQKEKKQQ